MDLLTKKEAFGQADRSWLANWSQVVGNNVGITVLTADLVKATHFPDGYIKQGMLLAQYTDGNAPFWGPYTPGALNGLQTALAAVYSDFRIKEDGAGNPLATQVAGAAVVLDAGVQVFVSKMPGTLDNVAAAHPIVTADLPSGWQDLDTF